MGEKDLVSAQGNLAEKEKTCCDLENSLRNEREKNSSKEAKLDAIRQSLLRTTSSTAALNLDSEDSLDDNVDIPSQILKLQEAIALSEKEMKKKIEIAVEEEKKVIVDKSKQFVLEREKENEERNRDLRHQIEMKDRKLTNMQAKLERQSDELRQMEHEVEQTKASCDNIIQQHEKQ